MSTGVNRQWVLKRRPSAAVSDDCFEWREGPIPTPGPGEALVRVSWLAIEPTQRTWLNEKATYIQPVALGEVMRGAGVGQVVASHTERLKVGDWVAGLTGWQDYVLAGDSGLFGFNKVPDGVAPKAMLNLFGASGLTAYFGMTAVGRVAPGETVLVSAAAGSVGSIAGQVARLRGCRVIGIAGGPHKAEWVTRAARFHACIDYKSEDLRTRLRALAPRGVDVVFDNVGGPILEAALDHLARGARVVLSGSVSSGYKDGDYGAAPRNYMQLGFQRARMEGFIFLDYVSRFPEAFRELAAWDAQGELHCAESIAEGLEQAPSALRGLFEGRNLGKQLVHVTASEGQAAGAAP
ncbi:NADP-dependent oxidoreductase [Corallococcus macrosporus]|uniref:NADP-dependent oxidoreductase n=1 Tax=Corallococcus macrosporus DSM 14697 TaxID=1189310 RepID=A0A250JZ73_9BACT|nr:NADP-dependent oxidoreductase [Corallococcus macrosporus]ATB48406.1 NADP-dependent oxidoreductase [Corallococcus macrosporus DSM 14697]